MSPHSTLPFLPSLAGNAVCQNVTLHPRTIYLGSASKTRITGWNRQQVKEQCHFIGGMKQSEENRKSKRGKTKQTPETHKVFVFWKSKYFTWSLPNQMSKGEDQWHSPGSPQSGFSSLPAETPEREAKSTVRVEADGDLPGRVQLALQLDGSAQSIDCRVGHLQTRTWQGELVPREALPVPVWPPLTPSVT